MQNYNLSLYHSYPLAFKGYSKEIKNTVNKDITDKNLEFSVKAKDGLTNRTYSGKINDLNYSLKNDSKIFDPNEITGNIADKKVDIIYDKGFKTDTLKGSIDNQKIDLQITSTWSGYKITGKYKDKNIDLELKRSLKGYELKGNNVDLKINNNLLNGDTIDLKGKLGIDLDLMPILITPIYDLCYREAQDAIAACAVGAGIIK